jgi:hypothetical protein
MNLSVRLAVLLLAPTLATAAPPTAAVPPEPGVEWENTVEMQMAGFSMPAQTTRSCVPKKGMTDPPGTGRDDKCKTSNVRNDGRKMSWTMTCEGKEKMSGEGEITQTADGYDGKMTMRTADGEMLMKMRGKKLGTPCDAATIKRQVAAIQAESSAQMAQSCREMAKGMVVQGFVGPQAMCKDPADRAALCERAASRDGVRNFMRQPEGAQKELGALCGKDFPAMKAQACTAAAKEEAAVKCKTPAGEDALAFIGTACPTETRPIAQRECAGLTYTDLQGSCYRSFCTTYAGDLLDKGKKPAAKPATPENSAQDAATKAVKSLLPF